MKAKTLAVAFDGAKLLVNIVVCWGGNIQTYGAALQSHTAGDRSLNEDWRRKQRPSGGWYIYFVLSVFIYHLHYF